MGETMDLIQQVTEQINKNTMVTAGEAVVVGVSGGPDSVALLHILYRLRENLNIRLIVAHLNHEFRGAEADADAHFVSELAERMQLEAFIESRDVPAYSEEYGVSAQVAAREVRYSFFSEVAVKTGASRVALGHHADDQAETILLHIIRGTGSGGLKGMLPVRDDFFIRPLLNVRRRDIEIYCRHYGLAVRHDSSNIRPKYLRNKVRLELFPLLEKNYNPNLVDTLNRLGEICRDEDEYLEREASAIYYQTRLSSAGDTVALDRVQLLRCPKAILRRIIRRAWSEICGDKDDLSFAHIDHVMEIIQGGGGYRQTTLPRGVTCKKNYDLIELTLSREDEEIPFYQHLLKVPGVTFIPEIGMSIEAQILPVGEVGDPLGIDPQEALLDYDCLSMPLVVRRRLDGDRFMPLGLGGSMKVKKFFIDHKVPRPKRDRIPLVVSGNDIIWVGGMRPGEDYKITEKTKTCLRLYINDYGR